MICSRSEEAYALIDSAYSKGHTIGLNNRVIANNWRFQCLEIAPKRTTLKREDFGSQPSFIFKIDQWSDHTRMHGCHTPSKPLASISIIYALFIPRICYSFIQRTRRDLNHYPTISSVEITKQQKAHTEGET